MWKYSVIIVTAVCYLYQTRETFDEACIGGKNVLITGGSKGIGRALALQYARLGASVMVTARNEQALKQVVSDCRRIGRKDAKFGYVVADMLAYEEAAEKVSKAAVDTLHGLDQVILNHAILPGAEVARFEAWNASKGHLEYLRRNMDVNFNSYVHLAGKVMPHLVESKGQLGVIGALAGKFPVYGWAPYCASKFALDGFFSTLRLEMKNQQTPVPITLCNLGAIETEEYERRYTRIIADLRLDEQKLPLKISPADLSETVMRVIAATTRGDRELYHPPLFGIDSWYTPLLRHIFPSVIEYDISQFRKE